MYEDRDNFNLNRHSKVVVKASLIIQLVDSYSGASPIEEGLSVTIEGVNRQPIKKAGGFFIFTNLAKGRYYLTIRSAHYLSMEQVLETEETSDLTPIIVSLLPRPSYPYQRDATVLSLSIENDRGEAIEGVKITATIVTVECSVAKLAQGELKTGEQEVILSKASEIYLGDQFLLLDKLTKKTEYCTIIQQDTSSPTYKLKETLTSDYSRGSMFLPTVNTISDEKGRVTLFFRNYLAKSYEIELKMEIGQMISEQKIMMTEGEKKNLGIVTI